MECVFVITYVHHAARIYEPLQLVHRLFCRRKEHFNVLTLALKATCLHAKLLLIRGKVMEHYILCKRCGSVS